MSGTFLSFALRPSAAILPVVVSAACRYSERGAELLA